MTGEAASTDMLGVAEDAAGSAPAAAPVPGEQDQKRCI
jgi:hypothetical protein